MEEQQLTLLPDLEATAANYPPEWPHHGKWRGYWYGCRCGRCQEARRARVAATRANAGSQRTCKRCGEKYYHVTNSGTGTKYCRDCKHKAYQEAVERHWQREYAPCAKCQETTPTSKKRAWHLCTACYATIPAMLVRTLIRHHAPVEFVLQIGAEPRCQACACDLTQRYKDRKGVWRYDMAVDHDHACCQSTNSCGACIRGLLCNSCNSALGLLANDPQRVAGLAAYIQTSPGFFDGAQKMTPVHRSRGSEDSHDSEGW